MISLKPKSLLNNFNGWYDGLEGTKRLLIFLAMWILSVGWLEIALALKSKSCIVIGLVTTGIICYIAASRAESMGRHHSLIGKGLVGIYLLVAIATLVVNFA